jgi:hypothetical protein
MAEKGILILDQSGGRSIATRDAVENDDQGHARLIQKVSTVSEKGIANITTEEQFIIPITDSDDGINYNSGTGTALPAAVTNRAIDVGDKSKLVLIPVSDESGSITFGNTDLLYVFPFVLDSNNLPVMPIMNFTMYVRRDVIFSHDGTKGYGYPHILDVSGAYKVTLGFQDTSGLLDGGSGSGSGSGSGGGSGLKQKFGISYYLL